MASTPRSTAASSPTSGSRSAWRRASTSTPGRGKAEAQAGAATARSKARSPRILAILAGLFAAAVTVFTAFYSRRLIRDLFARIDGQLGQIERQMEELEQIRATAGRLAAAAAEMRSAASESASATSEQSAAISEAASTIEQLNARGVLCSTSVSIAPSVSGGSSTDFQ